MWLAAHFQNQLRQASNPMPEANHIRTCQRLLKITADGICGPQMVSAVNEIVARCNTLQADNDAMLLEYSRLKQVIIFLNETIQDLKGKQDGLIEKIADATPNLSATN